MKKIAQGQPGQCNWLNFKFVKIDKLKKWLKVNLASVDEGEHGDHCTPVKVN